MKKIVLHTLLFFCLSAYGQPLPMPSLWLKSTDKSFVNYRGASMSVFLDGQGAKLLQNTALVNGYPALYLNSKAKDSYLTYVTDMFRGVSSALLLVAYEPFVLKNEKTIPEYGIWTLLSGDTVMLTSTHYKTNRGGFRYQFQNYPGAIVTSSLVSIKSNERGEEYDTLLFGKAGDRTFEGKFAEFIVVTEPINELSRRIWQSYLAFKYGSTLYKSDYLNSKGEVLWSYESNRDFSDGVGGIGRDDTLGINQNFSTIAGDGLTISLSGVNIDYQNDIKKFDNGEYIYWGHNRQELTRNLSIIPVKSNTYHLYNRIWKVQRHTKKQHLLDIRANNVVDGKLKMFISSDSNFDGWNTKVIDASICANSQAVFKEVDFADNDLYFTFGYLQSDVSNLNQVIDPTINILSGNSINDIFAEIACRPNPVEDNLYISYRLTRKATFRLVLYDNAGSIVYQTSPIDNNIGKHQTVLDMSKLVPGTYLLYIYVDDMVLSKVIIKR